MRLSHESQYWKDKVFVTLTYSPENLPENSTLVKSDLSDFVKRFRYYLPNVSLKYAGCGEYGPHGTFRPHYHLVIFGVNENDSRVFKKEYIPGKGIFTTCPAWTLGFVTVSHLNDRRCFYVARYCTKKLFGAPATEYYQGRQPEFYMTSKGIGEQWIKDHQVRVKMDNAVRFHGKKVPIPRYYIDKVYDYVDKWRRRRQNDREQEARMEKEYNDLVSDGILTNDIHSYSKYILDRFRQVQKEYAKRHEFEEKGKLKNE